MGLKMAGILIIDETVKKELVYVAGVLEGMFQYILAEHEDDDNIREKVLKFLTQKLKTLPEDTLDKDAEDFVVTQCRKVNIANVLQEGKMMR